MTWPLKLGPVIVLFWSTIVFAQAPPSTEKKSEPAESTPATANAAANNSALVRMGDMEITTDTEGVNFGPYLQRVVHDVKQNWHNVIPQAAMPPELKRGKVSIEFAILKNGKIADLRYVTSSGDVA